VVRCELVAFFTCTGRQSQETVTFRRIDIIETQFRMGKSEPRAPI
jgi:hypothetical protein